MRASLGEFLDRFNVLLLPIFLRVPSIKFLACECIVPESLMVEADFSLASRTRDLWIFLQGVQLTVTAAWRRAPQPVLLTSLLELETTI